MSSLRRYRPLGNSKCEVIMIEDESGNWTSLTCYYLLHDRVVRAEAEVNRLRGEIEKLKQGLPKEEPK